MERRRTRGLRYENLSNRSIRANEIAEITSVFHPIFHADISPRFQRMERLSLSLSHLTSPQLLAKFVPFSRQFCGHTHKSLLHGKWYPMASTMAY